MQIFGISNFSAQHAAPFIRLGWSASAGRAHLWDLLRERILCFVHLSPPGTTAGKARARQWPGAPPVVRSCEHPDGLSGLPSALRDRVQRQNSTFNFCAEVCRFCHDQHIFFPVRPLPPASCGPCRLGSISLRPLRAWPLVNGFILNPVVCRCWKCAENPKHKSRVACKTSISEYVFRARMCSRFQTCGSDRMEFYVFSKPLSPDLIVETYRR